MLSLLAGGVGLKVKKGLAKRTVSVMGSSEYIVSSWAGFGKGGDKKKKLSKKTLNPIGVNHRHRLWPTKSSARGKKKINREPVRDWRA